MVAENCKMHLIQADVFSIDRCIEGWQADVFNEGRCVKADVYVALART